MYVKAHGDRGCSLLAGAHIHAGQIDLFFCKQSGDIHHQTGSVIRIYGDIRGKQLSTRLLRLPFGLDHPLSVDAVHIQDVHTVGTVDRHAAASGDKADDLVSRDRITAFGETHADVMAAFDHDRTLVFTGLCTLLVLGHTL